MIRVYRYRLWPTRAQEQAMQETLRLLRELYNAALHEKRDAFRKLGASPSAGAQSRELKEVREVRPEFRKIHFHVLQDVITRLDRAMQAFFRRAKAGQTPGYPRFKGRGRYHAGKNNGLALTAGGKRGSSHRKR